MPTASYSPPSYAPGRTARDYYDDDFGADDVMFRVATEGSMRRSLSDPYAIVPYLQQNAENNYTESLSVGDYFDAAWTGAKHGLTTYGPELYYRAIHSLGTMLHSDGIKNWAREGIEENVNERESDPWYKPDPRWQQSWLADSLYQGFSNVTSSLEMAIPGIVLAGAAPLAGGAAAGAGLFAGLSAIALGSAASGGAIAGLAEYNSFVDEAYEQAKMADPNISRDMIEDDKFWKAVLSGASEGGFEFAGDFFMGKLAGVIGKQAAKPVSGVLQKAFRNVTYGMVSELGTEAATAAAQDYIREWADMDYKGRMQAILDIVGPTLVSGGVGGVKDTVMGHARQSFATPQEAEMAALGEFQKITNARRQESLSLHAFTEYQNLVGAGGESKQAHANMLVADALANRIASETGENPATVLQGMRESFPDMGEFVSSLRNKESTFDEVVDKSLGFLLGRLDGESQALIGSVYGDPVTGEVNARSLVDDLKLLISEKPIPETSGLANVMQDPAISGALQSMKNTFMDSAAALDSQSTIKMSAETRGIINNTESRKQFQEAPQPVMSFDKTAAEALNSKWKDADFSNPENVKQYLSESSGAISYNFDSIQPSTDPAATMATYKQMQKSLGNILEPLKAAQKRKPDSTTLANAQKTLESNSTLRSFLEKAAGTKNLDEAVVEMQLVIKAADTQFQGMVKVLAEGAGTPEMEFQALALMEHTNALKAVYDNTGTEVARALRARRTLRKGDPLYAEKMAAALNSVADGDARNKFYVAMSNIENEAQLSKVVNLPVGVRTTDAIMEYITSNLLYGPSTHVTNILGNTLNILNHVFSRFIAEPTMRAPTEGGVVKGEAISMLYGFWNSTIQLRETWKTHRDQYAKGMMGTAQALAGASDIWARRDLGDTQGSDASDQRMRRAISRENALAAASKIKETVGLSAEHGRISNGAATLIDYFGKVVGMPFVLLEHSDNIFKTIYQGGALNALIHRAANGDATLEASMHKNPPKDLVQQAKNEARQVLFQEDYGKVGKALNDIRNAQPWTRVFMPFLKTPINILKEGIRMTPVLSDVMSFTRQELNSPDMATRQIAEARVMTGTLVMGTALTLAANGMLTGSGPEDPDERKRWLASGRRPNSLVIGDQYFQIDRLDPLAVLFNAAALMVDAKDILDDEDATKAMWTLMGQAIDIAASRTYLSSLTDIVGILTNPEQNAPRMMQRMGGMLVPASAMMRTINRDDPHMREVDDFWDGIRQNVPGLSKSLPMRRDFLGQPIESNDYLGPNWLSPFVTSHKKNDPVYEEVVRLQNLGLRSAPVPSRTISKGSHSTRMSGKEYSEFLDFYGNEVKINGRSLYSELGKIVSNPSYASMGDSDKANAIRATALRYGREARKGFLERAPRLQSVLGIKAKGWEFLMGNAIPSTE